MSANASEDLELAKKTFFEEKLSLVVAKNGKVLFRSKSHGVSDLLATIEHLGQLSEGAALADRIVGRAAALLCAYSEIVAVYGANMSESAVSFLKANGIRCEYGALVPRILNRDKTDICPFEKAVLGIEDSRIALDKLKSLRLG
jgi:hypothetical protein